MWPLFRFTFHNYICTYSKKGGEEKEEEEENEKHLPRNNNVSLCKQTIHYIAWIRKPILDYKKLLCKSHKTSVPHSEKCLYF